MDAFFEAAAVALAAARTHAGREGEAALMLAADGEAEMARREEAWASR
jgi:hypothetical protein